MPILDTVLFDNDGTLVDTYDLILESFHHAVREVLGRDIADEAHGQGGPAAFDADVGFHRRPGGT